MTSAAVFRTKPAERFTLLACGIMVCVLALFVGALLIAMAHEGVSWMLFWSVILAVHALLAALILSEWVAARHLLIDVREKAVALRLPRLRGHVKHAAVAETIPYSAIARIETRAEAFRQLGIVAVQRAYRLVLKDGQTIELGADRQLKEDLFGPAAEAIAERADVEIDDRGMVDGAAGVLAAWGTAVPGWSAPSLGDAEIATRLARASRVWTIVGASLTLVMIARLIARR